MKILVVGCGSIGQRHLQNLRTLSAGELMVFDTSRERSLEAGAKYGATDWPSFEEALSQGPDAVLICTPTSQHIDYALTAIENYSHLFIEKPISHSLEGVQELADTAKARGRVVLVGCNFRFHWGIKLARRLIAGGKIGRVLFAQAEFGQYLPSWHPGEDYRQGYSAQQALGGGIILDSIHELDYLHWFFGDADEVYCRADKLSDLEIDVEDTAEIILNYANNILARVHLDYIQRAYNRSLKVVGEEGVITWSFSDNSVAWYPGEEKVWRVLHKNTPYDVNDMYLAEMKHFISCIQGYENPMVDACEGKSVLEVALAAKNSAELRRPVSLETSRKL